MNKKITLFVCALFTLLSMTACGQVKEKEAEPTPSQPESSAPPSQSTPSALTAEQLLDGFIGGTIAAVDPSDPTAQFYITDLNMGGDEWDCYSIGERTDLDNDGEDELILCGPYGGIYLDARDNSVYTFAAGDGAANTLSYTYYNGAVWLLYSNSMNAGYEAYHMEKFEGVDDLTAQMDFGEELVDQNDPQSAVKYTLNGNEISYEEYADFCSKIFAAQVSTN